MKLPWKKNPEPEQNVLVCVSFDEPHVELSKLDVCRDCGAQIWVSPHGQKLAADQNLKIICIDCMPDPRDDDVKISPPDAEQIAEILASGHFPLSLEEATEEMVRRKEERKRS